MESSVTADNTGVVAFNIESDPATHSTAQMKKYGFRNGKIRTFTNAKVARAMRIITFLARAQLRKVPRGTLPPFGTPIRLDLTFHYAIPATRRKGRNAYREGEGATAHWTADCDNRAKAVIDALVNAGICENDKDITALFIRKRWIVTNPHIHVEIRRDDPDRPATDKGENAQ